MESHKNKNTLYIYIYIYMYIYTHTHSHGSVHRESIFNNCPTRCDLVYYISVGSSTCLGC